jgi:hypothetical protein
MRKTLLACIITAALAFGGGGASAQLNIKAGPIVEPTTGLSSQDWLDFETSHAALDGFSNAPWLLAYNATNTPVTIRCDDEPDYDLVGKHNYNDGNITFIPAWSYAPVQVKGWDNYCKGTALKGFSASGVKVYRGIMEKSGDFRHSRWLAILQ